MLPLVIITILASLSSMTLARSHPLEIETNFFDFYDGTLTSLRRPLIDILIHKHCFLNTARNTPDYIELQRHLKANDYFAAGIFYGRYLNNNCVYENIGLNLSK